MSDIKKAVDFVKKYKTQIEVKHQINTKKRKAAFMANLLAESGLVSKREGGYFSDVNYVRSIFKTPFKGKSDAFVLQYLKNSKKMLNYVYANRMGNGNEASGDGYKYRGGGFLQNTGKSQYEQLEKDTGIPFAKNPDLITEEANALIAALNFWSKNNLNKHADTNFDAVCDLINLGRLTDRYGDSNHFKVRKAYYDELLKVF